MSSVLFANSSMLFNRNRQVPVKKTGVKPRTRQHSEETGGAFPESTGGLDTLRRYPSSSMNLDTHDTSRLDDADDQSLTTGSIERQDSLLSFAMAAQQYNKVDPFNPNAATKPSATGRRWVHTFPMGT